jgi:hypothetical protein
MEACMVGKTGVLTLLLAALGPGCNCGTVGTTDGGVGTDAGNSLDSGGGPDSGVGVDSGAPDGGAIADAGSDAGVQSVSVTLTHRPAAPANYSFLVAYQDGAAPWALAPAPTGDTSTFPITSGSWGVAWTCVGSGGIRTVREARFTTAERTLLTVDIPAACSDRYPAPVPLSGTIVNALAGGCYLVHFGDRVAQATQTTGPLTYSLETPPGTQDLIVLHANPCTPTSLIATDAYFQSQLTVAGASTANVDFSTAKPTQVYTVSISGQGTPATETVVYTSDGTVARLDYIDGTAGSTFKSMALPSEFTVVGFTYEQISYVYDAGSGIWNDNWSDTGGNQTYSGQPGLSGTAAQVASQAPYPRIQTTWTAYPNAVGYAWTLSQALSSVPCDGGVCEVTWRADLSPGATGSSPRYEMPDLSALPGWPATLQLTRGAPAQLAVTAQTSTAGGSDFPAVVPAAAGTTRSFASSTQSVTP